jgi:hypothetical protein
VLLRSHTEGIWLDEELLLNSRGVRSVLGCESLAFLRKHRKNSTEAEWM